MEERLDIAKNIKVIEWLKAELLSNTAECYRRIAVMDDTDDVSEGLANILISAYLLASRLGIGHAALELKVLDTLRDLIGSHDLEKQYGDLSSLSRYISAVRKGSLS